MLIDGNSVSRFRFEKKILMASQMRDKIVKEGLIRYRQSTIGLQKVSGCFCL